MNIEEKLNCFVSPTSYTPSVCGSPHRLSNPPAVQLPASMPEALDVQNQKVDACLQTVITFELERAFRFFLTVCRLLNQKAATYFYTPKHCLLHRLIYITMYCCLSVLFVVLLHRVLRLNGARCNCYRRFV